MRYLPLAIFWLLVVQNAIAQSSGISRLSASLKTFLAADVPDPRFITARHGTTYVPLFIELEPGSTGLPFNPKIVRLRTRTGNIMTVDVPINLIWNLASEKSIRRMELPLLLTKLDTTMKRLVTADRVIQGHSPLTRGFTGKNVLIGVIDDGLDISHPDFLDSNGKSRVTELWNMDQGGNPPVGYSYGHVWTQDSINHYANLFNKKGINELNMQKLFGYGGHGTPVTSLAAGKNGTAPGAAIVSVALSAFADTLLRSDRLIDAIAYIYSRARSLNKKCVINISLGVLDGGPHDGKSMVERAIDEFCSEKPDILVAVSAGNSGNSWKHWGGMPIHKDSSFGFFRCAYKASMYFTIPKQHSANLSFSIAEAKLGNVGNPNISRDSIFYQTPFVNIAAIIDSNAPVQFESYSKTSHLSSTITFSASHYNEDYDELIVTTFEHSSGTGGIPFDDHLYRFIFKGIGTVHGWYPFANLHPIYFFDRNPYPNDPTYRSTDNQYTTGIPSNAFTVLSTGAYNIRSCYVSNIHNEVVSSFPSCQVTYFTSHGPTLDGRVKPDIIAPGENVLAARSRMDTYTGHQFIIDTSLQSFSGTSAASPIAAGIAALIWESDSTLTRNVIIQKIKSSAYNDDFTAVNGPVPNNISGYGKIDAFKAITGLETALAELCASNPICEIKNPIRGPGPVISGGTLENFYLKLFPNPAKTLIWVSYRSPVPVDMIIYNSVGQMVLKRSLQPNNTGQIVIVPLHALASGSYFVRVSGKDILITKQFVITGK
ncbi:S8 family peptidase [Flavitalea sp.]|nr:S8 family peptidase [Flavitalea sp.]